MTIVHCSIPFLAKFAVVVVVVPSLRESMNRVCAEAAATGTPFIVTASTGVAGLVTEPGVGQIVPTRDPGAMATAINGVLDGGWQLDAVTTRRFLQQFDASRVAPRLLELIASASPEQ